MKRRELMAIVAIAAGLSAGLSATTQAQAVPNSATEQDIVHPGHFIGHGHFQHGNGHGYGHNHHDHDIY
jgi:hypothetical protein